MNTTLLRQSRNSTVACIVFFAAFILFSIFRVNFQSIDVAVNLWTATIHTDLSVLLAKVLSTVFDTTIIVAASLVIAAVLFIKKQKAQSVLLLTAIGGDALFVSIIKNIDPVLRPENQLLIGSGFSYPSGHSAGVIVFIGLIAYYVWLHWNTSARAKSLALAAFGLVVAFVSFDRVYLNVHWLSDVVGGWLFGAFWLSFCIMVYERLQAAGKFETERFNLVANVLFALGFVVAVMLVSLGWFFNYLTV
ncbi:MAG: phosphatase PAP2 family protein [Candidatus Bathyarchaeia archaeon]